MKRLATSVAAGLVLTACLGSAEARAETRLALVAGVSNYGPRSLANTTADAALVASALKDAGFSQPVPLPANPTKHEIEAAVAELARLAEAAGEETTVAFYFAGHGVKIADHDYLIPAASTLLTGPHSARDFRVEAVDAEAVLDTLSEARPARVLLFLDACHDSPILNQDRGAPPPSLGDVPMVRGGPDTVIFFAAEPGGVADDGGPTRTHGWFASRLAEAIRRPGNQLHDVLEQVRTNVRADSGKRQTPYPEGGAFAFTFIAGPSQAAAPTSSPALDDERTWEAIKALDSAQGYGIYLELYGSGVHAAEARTLEAARARSASSPTAADSGVAGAMKALARVTQAEWEASPRQAIATKVITLTTLADLRRLGDRDDAKALFVLAALYEFGFGGAERNPDMAKTLYGRAADRGDPGARFVLGDDYYFGINGEPKDPARARDLFLSAAKAGQVDAASRLGDIYLGYTTLPKDDGLALHYVTIAANRGEPWAQCRLGRLYDEGRLGLKRDEDQARAWAERSARQGNYCGQVNLSGMYLEGSHHLPKDIGKAIELAKLAAASGAAEPAFNLAILNEGDVLGKKDLSESVRWYEVAARQGYGPAQDRLGYFYREGVGTPKNPQRSAEMFERAAAQGLADAQHELGVAYKYGAGVTKDEHRATELFERAAAQGDALAQAAAGQAYLDGSGVARDERKAVAYFEASAKQKDSDGQFRLALATLAGQGGLTADPKAAADLMRASAARGYKPAVDWLAAHASN